MIEMRKDAWRTIGREGEKGKKGASMGREQPQVMNEIKAQFHTSVKTLWSHPR